MNQFALSAVTLLFKAEHVKVVFCTLKAVNQKTKFDRIAEHWKSTVELKTLKLFCNPVKFGFSLAAFNV